MTVAEVITQLSKYPPAAEIRIAHQPHWPFEYEVRDIVSNAELEAHLKRQDNRIVWLVEGRLLGHFTSEAWRAALRKRS